jgi:hypothetical protein
LKIAEERGHNAVVHAIQQSLRQPEPPLQPLPPPPEPEPPEPEPELEPEPEPDLANPPGLGEPPAGLGEPLQPTLSTAASNKYSSDANHMVLGQPHEAADGINALLGIGREKIAEFLTAPILAMEAEYRAVGAAAHAVFAKHNLPALLDILRQKRPTAKLECYHVLALRLYTTEELYPEINTPLRRATKPHPLAATVYFIHDAIKVCRAVSVDVKEQTLWRGLKDVQIPKDLMAAGGSERACMR